MDPSALTIKKAATIIQTVELDSIAISIMEKIRENINPPTKIFQSFCIIFFQGICDDINECLPGTDQLGGEEVGIKYCGDDKGLTCVNTAGSFQCSCKSGCSDFIPYIGCSDVEPTCSVDSNCRLESSKENETTTLNLHNQDQLDHAMNNATTTVFTRITVVI